MGPPRSWAFAEGQILPIVQNTALFAILGTTYGGNGITTFALPDLRGRTIVGAGAGVGLDERLAGEVFGVENQPLTESQLPPHAHAFTSFNADFDGDNDVDGSDFLAWQQNLGASPNATHAQGDANFDGDVDDFDLSVWATQFGNPPPPSATRDPEPMSLGMAWYAMFSAAIASFRRSPVVGR
jgi:microcystin-dependent protein